jgi:uncharacterized protein with NAD-binding domain and iron-sulfur cluster
MSGMGTVYILGGGVAGLSAAHELAQRNFNVVLFERDVICGGKARSMPNLGSGTGGRPDLPGEHGFRFFPGFYWHLTDTMKRIDVGGGRTADQNLQTAAQISIAQDGKPLFFMASKFPKTLQEWVTALRLLFEDPSLGLSIDEARFFLRRIICFLGSGPTRRLEQLEKTSWWDYIDASNPSKSDQYRKILGRGLSQSLVAMKPEKASALTVGAMFVQIVLNIVSGEKADRILNAPTNEAWIDPWEAQLTAHPFNVTIKKQHTVTAINYNAGTKVIDSVTVVDKNNVSHTVGTSADYFLSALPVDVLQLNTALFPTSFKRAAGLSRVPQLGDPVDDGVDKLETEWMNGVLFYLNRDVSCVNGHIIYADSSWALTSISQRQFWHANYPWANKGDGTVQDILSTIISDWDTPGNKVVTKPARHCTKAEIFQETWAQAKAHLAHAGNGALNDGDRVTQFLDPAIKFDNSGNVSNVEPLLVNNRDSRKHRPPAKTLIPNFFVASDYVLTETDLACMEAANESARQAVNAVLVASNSAAQPCQIQPLKEPGVFKPFQQLDETEYAANPTQPPLLCRVLDIMLPIGDAPPAPLTTAEIAGLAMAGVNLVLLLFLIFNQ